MAQSGASIAVVGHSQTKANFVLSNMSAVAKFPEEQIFTEESWSLIPKEILTATKPYLDVELKVLIEERIFATSREQKETFSSYVTRKTNKYRDLCANLGFKSHECSHCGKAN